MCRKRRVLQVLLTSCTLAIIIAVATTLLVHFYGHTVEVTLASGIETMERHGATALLDDHENASKHEEMRDLTSAEANNEVRSVPSPSYVQSRPIYQKPKPKLVLPKQLQQQKQSSKPSQSEASLQKAGLVGVNPHLVTQTVYGFLDFVTTVGNTVMIFTPQTKKVGLIASSSSSLQRETVLLQPTAIIEEKAEADVQEVPKHQNQRTARLLEIDAETVADDGTFVPEELESSEYEPQVFATAVVTTPQSTPDMTYISLKEGSSSVDVSSDPVKGILSSNVAIVTSEPEVRTQVNVVTAVKASEQPQKSTASKGFTLKFPRPSSSSVPSSAKKVKDDFKTGIVSHNVESRVNNGVTTVHETKVLGTFIGTQYARILESSSSVLPSAVTSSRVSAASKSTEIPPMVKQSQIIESVPETPETFTVRSVSSSSNFETDPRFNDELLGDEEGPEEMLGANEEESSIKPEPTPTITATASEASTQYVLPQKEPKAQIYASPIPSPNAYSREPQIYVDEPPTADFVAAATPARKPFRPQSPRSTETSSRFTNRFNKNPQPAPQTSTESNELLLSYDAALEDNARRTSNRFRSNRNRSGYKPSKQIVEAEILPTTASKYIMATSAPPTRKFTRGRSGGAGKSGEDFKLGGRSSFGNGGSPSRQHYISPTTSTSIYRFKLNRPTGRWRFKPSPKPKVNIIKTKEEEELAKKELLQAANSNNGVIYPQNYNDQGESLDIHTGEESRTESNELIQDFEAAELVPETIRVATVTPTEFSDFENSRMIEIATIRSPYVFQAGNVKNTRYITLTKTFTKEMIQPTQVAPSFGNPSLENILATRAPYERILDGSNNIATLPLIILGSGTATPPLETVTQTFSTTQLMLKTSILPVLYDGVTTLYTLTQSYLITRLVAAYKTIPPAELFHFVPTKSLTEFNTALQEAGTEHREHLLGSESSENDANYENIVAPPDELTSLGSDFDPSSMDEKYIRTIQKSQKAAALPKSRPQEEQATIPDFANLSPEQLAFLRYFTNAGQQGHGLIPMQNPLQNYFPSPLLPSLQGQFQGASSPVVLNTVTTIVETKTLRIQFGSKPTHTIIYSTKIIPTKVTSYVAASVPSTPAIGNYFQPHPFPIAYVG